jgi:acetyltransferase-like isoleucine patch superfamily enzyme
MCAIPGVFTMAKRVVVMARIRSRGNRDTEHALAGNPARCVQRIRRALEARNEG